MSINSKSAITNSIINSLTRVYPRAMSYAQLFDIALNGVPASQRSSMNGGSYMRNLEKQKRVKKVTTGFYCLIPN